MTLILEPDTRRPAPRPETITTAPARAAATAVAPPDLVPTPSAALPQRPRRTRRVVSRRQLRWVALLMIGLFALGVGIEPAPTGPDPVLPAWVDLIATATLVALLASWIALAAGRRSGLWSGAIAGLSLVTQSALCPALDHHVIAPWWWGQLAISAGMAALCVGLLVGTRARAS